MGKFKDRVHETLIRKEGQLLEIYAMRKTIKKKLTKKALDKNEIELKAQIAVLRHLLS